MKIARVLASVCALVVAANARAGERLRYVIYTADGTRAGEQVSDHGNDGRVRVHFIFKDNGRGPELDEEYRLAPDGTYAEYRVKGTSTYGAKVDEKFTRTGDRAAWTSTSERGEKRVSGPAMYVPLNGTIDANSVSIAATAKVPGGKLPLLPAGTLTQRRLDEAEVTRPGGSQRVHLYAQTGQGLTPSFFWATAGETPRIFAFIYPGYIAAIEEGWDDNRAALEARQKKAEAALLQEMAGRLMKPLDGLTVIRNARVFDSEKAALGPASNVYVLRGRISAVTLADAPVGGADREIDAAGRVLLPGLFDMHSHSDRWQGGLNIAAGVTTTRDMGGDNTTVQQIIDETESGRLLGPHIVPAGFLEGDGPNAARGGFVIKNLQEAKDAVDWYAAHGYPQLKIYNSFPKELVRETAAYAHSRGMRVGGHVPAFLRAQEAVEQGFDEIQHINQVLLNFFVTPTTDTRTLERFYLVAEKTAGLNFDSRPVQDFIALLQKQPTVIDTTLGTFDFLRQRDGDVPQVLAAVFEHLPIDVQRSRRVGQMKIPDAATAARYEKSYAKMIEFVGRLYRAGIPLVAGTDEMAGFVLQRELELYVQAGLTPSQALQVATWNAAKYSRTLSDRGTIEPGKRADLVLIDGDPTQNIADIRRVALVITQGKIAVPSEIDRELGIAPFVGKVPEVVDLRQKGRIAEAAR